MCSNKYAAQLEPLAPLPDKDGGAVPRTAGCGSGTAGGRPCSLHLSYSSVVVVAEPYAGVAVYTAPCTAVSWPACPYRTVYSSVLAGLSLPHCVQQCPGRLVLTAACTAVSWPACPYRTVYSSVLAGLSLPHRVQQCPGRLVPTLSLIHISEPTRR